MGYPHQLRDYVDWSNPVNWEDPLNRDTILWLMAVPGYMGFGSFVWRDLCLRFEGTLTNMDPKTDWVAGSDSGGWGCLDFITDDSVRVPHNALFPTNNFTLTAWVNMRTGGTSLTGRVIAKRSSSIQYDWIASSGEFNGFSPSVSPSLNIWNRLVVTFSSGTITHYLNGKPNGTGTGTVTEDAAAGFWVGNLQLTNRALDGVVDDIRVVTRVWDANEVARDYTLRGQYYPGVLNRKRLQFDYIEQSAGGGGGGGSTGYEVIQQYYKIASMAG